MGSNLSFFASVEDDRELVAVAKSIGLQPVPAQWDERVGPPSVEDPATDVLAYLSRSGLDALHPYGDRPLRRISYVDDPLLQFVRSYYNPPHLIAGRLWWPGSPREMAAISKPYFEKLRRWMKKNWHQREEDKYFIGPGAEHLVKERGALLSYLPPFTTIETVRI